MTGTRRSTRQKTTKAPKYAENESSSLDDETLGSENQASKRRKRTREDAEVASPRKMAKPIKEHFTASAAKPESTEAKRPITLSSNSNRDANGNQEVFWLLKAEPLPRYENGVNVAFSIDDLAACTAPEPWSGVRNPQARNNMQAMRVGDLGFFYHSNAKPSGVAGILRVVEEAKVDESAFDSKDPYFDPKSDLKKPKWYCTSVEFVSKFEQIVDLHAIKSFAGKGGKLEGMQLVTNSRLSVSRVRKEEWDFILDLAKGTESSTKEEQTEEALKG